MKFDKRFCLLILILFFISLSFVSATSDADQTVELINDEKLSVDPSTFTDLQNDINVAGDTINLEKDYQYDSEFTKNGIVINKTITINGNGKSIDGANSARIFNITANDVVIENLNFLNGYVKVDENAADNGAAVYCTGSNLVLKNCTFTNNYAGCHGGGAVYVEGEKCNITGCEFTENTGSNSGGAVKLTGDNSIVENSKFTKNTAVIRHGGALYIVANDVKIMNNEFTENIAKYSGGALRVVGNNTIISNNKFAKNNATNTLGGAVSILGNDAQITDNTFEKNYAGRDGGAVDIEGDVVDTNSKNAVVKNNIFNENTVGEYGGGLSINTHNGLVENNTFTKNTAGKLGGALRVTGADSNSITITKNTIENNVAGVSGGGAYINGSGTIIDDNTFTSNTATSTAGGAINIHGDSNVIKNNAINSNKANMSGGAIYAEGNNFDLTENTIQGCSAGTSGGALYLKGDSKASIKDNKFIKNTAETLAGAIQIKTDEATITGNEFKQNTAKGSGGAIYSEGKSYKVAENNFTANAATGESSVGGAIRHVGDDATIINNRFEDNTASSGWSIYGDGSGETTAPNKFVTSDQSKEIVWKHPTTLTVPDKTFRVTLSGKYMMATLKDSEGNVVAGKTVSFIINGHTYSGKTNANGVVKVTYNLNVVKSYPVTVKFNGDAQYRPCNQTATLKLIKENTRISAPSKVYYRSSTKKVIITLKSVSKKALYKKKITLRINGRNYVRTTNSKGQATFKVSLTKKSKYIYKVTFAGDSQYNTISNKGTITVR